MTAVHVHPVEDVIDHETATPECACVCGPIVFPQVDDDGNVRELIVHHSLCCEGEWIAGPDLT